MRGMANQPLPWNRRACPWCRRIVPAEPHTGTLHQHSMPREMRPGNPAIVTCPGLRPDVVLRILYGG